MHTYMYTHVYQSSGMYVGIIVYNYAQDFDYAMLYFVDHVYQILLKFLTYTSRSYSDV